MRLAQRAASNAIHLPPTARIVPGFSHQPGHHCASTALADLARWNGLPWSEAMCFGLGAGVGFTYVERDGETPSRLIIPRAAELELAFLDAIGLPQAWRRHSDAAAAWDAVRAELDSGRPVLMLTDLYYLDYYETTTHFSGHALVLAGYDPEQRVAYTADTERPGLQQTSLASLARARQSRHFPTPVEHNWLPGGPWQLQRPLGEAVPAALLRAARQMLEPDVPGNGIAGLRLWADRIGQWAEQPDWAWAARFAYQIIERRGTGGAAFRRLYRAFLVEAARYVPALPATGAISAADEATTRWREVALELRRLSLSEHKPDFNRLQEPIVALAEAEERLFSAVRDAVTAIG